MNLHKQALRQEICLNGLWDFKSEADNKWTQVQVPCAYAGGRQSWGGIQWDCFDYPTEWAEKASTYKRTFTLPPELKNMEIRFYCGACAHHTKIMINGVKVGEWHDGYTPIEFSLTSALVDGENILEIHVTDQESDLFDDHGTNRRGIWQDVYLKAYPAVSINKDFFVKTFVEKNEIACEVPVDNVKNESGNFKIVCVVTELDGSVVKSFEGEQFEIAAGESKVIEVSSSWADAQLWFPHDPHLYYINAIICDANGNAIDNIQVRFGFREITWKGPHMYINGRELFLRGHGGHYFGDIQGSREYMETWLGNMKKLGINFMRLHNSPKHIELYEVADEMGIMLEAEGVFHFKVPEETSIWQDHLENLVKAQRNHPAIIVWSVSNELRWRGGGEKPEMIEYVRNFDTTRPVFASDFSLESRFGDICMHHYDPASVFEDWEEFGPDKPMIWDELGSVWQHDRPLDNGTSGYEAQAQDFATGLWYDGHDQILKDIKLQHDGKFFAGEFHRVSGFVPWDLAYVFFRWQPFNNNKILNFKNKDLTTKGIKLKHLRPSSSPANPWDPTLPEFEPNPGYYLFEKYMRAVRCFDDVTDRTFFADSKLTLKSKIFYDDTRFVDEFICRVETLDGKILHEQSRTLSIIPGQIMENVICEFTFPHIDQASNVNLVREFRYLGEAGYSDLRPVKIFPRIDLNGITFGKIGNVELSAFEQAGATIVDGFENVDILLISKSDLYSDQVQSYIKSGGKIMCLDGASDKAKSRGGILESFTDSKGELNPETGLVSSEACAWYGWSPKDPVTIYQKKWGLDHVNGRLSFNNINKAGAYAYAHFTSPLEHVEEGLLNLKFESHAEKWKDLIKDDPELFDRNFGVLICDANKNWFLSREESDFKIGQNGFLEIVLADMNWQQVVNVKNNLITGSIKTSDAASAASPDFSKLYGSGIYMYRVPVKEVEFWFSKIEWTGRSAPGALIPFNGSQHKLLAGIEQQDLSFWRGLSSNKIVNQPEQGNYRVILAGNKDGMGAALYEQMSGKGIALVTSLNLQNLDKEPSASAILNNIVTYLKNYTPENVATTAVLADDELNAYLDELGVITTDKIAGASTIIVDGKNANSPGIDAAVKAGSKLLVYGVDSESISSICELTGRDMQLTDPFLGERKHCVKAAISWTKVDTPVVMSEYYEGVMAHQPFEPNYDPILNGIANYDLNWDGVDMFQEGIEIKGMDPVRASNDYNILLSNWKIDWRKPLTWGGEYIHAPKDKKRANWFINRDAVLFKVKHGKGEIIFCQLDLINGGEKGKRVATQVLSNLGCSLGQATCFASIEETFDISAGDEQIARFNKQYDFLKPATREYYGTPEHLTVDDDDSDSDNKIPATLLIGDDFTLSYHAFAMQEMWETHDVHQCGASAGSSRDGITYMQQNAFDNFKIIQISFGLEDLKLGEDGLPQVGIDEFKKNLQTIIDELKQTKAKLYWTTIIPLPKGLTCFNAGDEIEYNNAAQKIMDANDVYTNDIHHFIMEKFPEFAEGDTLDMNEEQLSAIGKQVAQAITFFGAQ